MGMHPVNMVNIYMSNLTVYRRNYVIYVLAQYLSYIHALA